MINVSIKRIGVALAAVLLLIALVGGGIVVSGSWVTPRERMAIGDALTKIDAVAMASGNNPHELEAKVQAAKAATELCRKRIITEYDSRLTMMLDMQLDGAKAEHTAKVKASADQRYARVAEVIAQTNRDTEAMFRSHIQ